MLYFKISRTLSGRDSKNYDESAILKEYSFFFSFLK